MNKKEWIKLINKAMTHPRNAVDESKWSKFNAYSKYRQQQLAYLVNRISNARDQSDYVRCLIRLMATYEALILMTNKLSKDDSFSPQMRSRTITSITNTYINDVIAVNNPAFDKFRK